MAADRATLRAAQLAAVLGALAAEPGLTAYQVGLHIPPDPGRAGVLARTAPLTLSLNLLSDLEKTGRARHVDDPKGNRWYLTDPPVASSDMEAS